MANKNNEKQSEISQKTFEGLLSIQCTRDEICAVLGVTKNTLKAWVRDHYDGATFEEVSLRYRSVGKVSLRRSGLKLAEKNPAVWIFMAKNYLGMTDTVAPEPDTESVDALASAFKTASKSVGNLAGLAQVPSKDEEAKD